MNSEFIVIILILLLPVMFLLGFLIKKPEYKHFMIKNIKAVQDEDSKTWTFEPPVNVSKNINYIFIVNMPKGQEIVEVKNGN